MRVLGHPIEDVILWKAEPDMGRPVAPLDEDRLARALLTCGYDYGELTPLAAQSIAKAYREDTDHE